MGEVLAALAKPLQVTLLISRIWGNYIMLYCRGVRREGFQLNVALPEVNVRLLVSRNAIVIFELILFGMHGEVLLDVCHDV